jgi:hypothetical protein
MKQLRNWQKSNSINEHCLLVKDELVHKSTNNCENGVDNRQEHRWSTQEVNQGRNLANGVNLVCTAPCAPVPRPKLEQFQRVLDTILSFVGRIRLNQKIIYRLANETGILTELSGWVTSATNIASITAFVVSCWKISKGLKYGMPP